MFPEVLKPLTVLKSHLVSLDSIEFHTNAAVMSTSSVEEGERTFSIALKRLDQSSRPDVWFRLS